MRLHRDKLFRIFTTGFPSSQRTLSTPKALSECVKMNVYMVCKCVLCLSQAGSHLSASVLSGWLSLSLRAPSLLHCRRVFPRGLPEEFALVLTVLLKKHTFRNTWYLFQVTDANGYPQVSPLFRSPNPWSNWLH